MERSVPPFPFDFSTEPVTLLVVGSAPCLTADLDVAKGLRPSHLIMAINDAARWIPADMVFSYHASRIPEFAAGQRKFNTEFTTHGDARKIHRNHDCADYFWHDLHHGATSAVAGAHAGLYMGFQEVILCGCPMNGGDGYAGPTAPNTAADPRFGFKMPGTGLIQRNQTGLKRFATIAKDRVFSLSGFSQQILGAPPEVPIYGH